MAPPMDLVLLEKLEREKLWHFCTTGLLWRRGGCRLRRQMPGAEGVLAQGDPGTLDASGNNPGRRAIGQPYQAGGAIDSGRASGNPESGGAHRQPESGRFLPDVAAFSAINGHSASKGCQASRRWRTVRSTSSQSRQPSSPSARSSSASRFSSTKRTPASPPTARPQA